MHKGAQAVVYQDIPSNGSHKTTTRKVLIIITILL